MKHYPDHLNDTVRDASDRFRREASEYHWYYQLVCHCGGKLFDLMLSDKQTVMAICAACNERIVLYDLAKYPAATKLSGEESFEPMNSMPRRPCPVYVHYEYGALDDGMEFDPNDITWFAIFCENNDGELTRIFDDETA